MKIVIVGNGVAGMTAAEAIRERDTACEIVMYSDEARFHYSRPRIIEYLSGKVGADKLIICNADFYAKNRIDLVAPAVVTAIDTEAKKIMLKDGRENSFDRLIIASGASSYLPPVEGAHNDGVFTLRTIANADAILKFCEGKKKALVIGGGLLGIETASSLKSRGLDTTVVEVFQRLLPRQLDADGALILQNMLEARGLRFLLARQTAGIEKADNGLCVKFRDGSSVETDLVLFSAGIRSNTSLAENSGLACERGILVDEHMRTSASNIYAAGDAAQFGGVVYGLWPPAKEQGTFAGRNAIGDNAVYPGSAVSTRLKVTGIELASLGAIEQGEGVSVVTESKDGNFKRLFIREGKLVGAILIGDASSYNALQKVMKSGEDVTGSPLMGG